MELPPDYWQEVRDNCAVILAGQPSIRSWAIWPVVRTERSGYGWTNPEGAPESLVRYIDRMGVLGNRALRTSISHELTIAGDEFPRLVRLDLAEQRILSAFPAPGHALPMGWSGNGVEPQVYDQVHDALARGVAAVSQPPSQQP